MKTQEQLYNRIMINFGIGILAYTLLYFLYQKLYMDNLITFICAGVFALSAAVCYLYKGKKSLKNYGHMFIVFALALLFTRLSVLTATVVGIDKFIELQGMYWFKKLMQTRTEVTILAWGGAVYLVIMLIYNLVKMINTPAKRR